MEAVSETLKNYTETELATEGNYMTEDEAKRDFRSFVINTNMFNMYEEIECSYFGAPPFAETNRGRIDFVLSPKKTLIDAGWCNGFVGVEVKKSGHKAGPLVAQMLDYSRSVFQLEPTQGCIRGVFSSVLCFPAIPYKGFCQSLLSQNTLGVITARTGVFRMLVGSRNILTIYNGEMTVNAMSCGWKVGSR
jgi:hypothetical protein